jgi:DNA invertase Pin-like site-specific DNA recombinase
MVTAVLPGHENHGAHAAQSAEHCNSAIPGDAPPERLGVLSLEELSTATASANSARVRGAPDRDCAIRLFRLWHSIQSEEFGEYVNTALIPPFEQSLDEAVRTLWGTRTFGPNAEKVIAEAAALEVKCLGAAYSRYSCRESKPTSLDDQLRSILRRAASAGHDGKRYFVPWEFVFVDAGISGLKFKKRPGILALTRLLQQHSSSPHHVYFFDFSRVTRNPVKCWEIQVDRSLNGGRRWIGVSDGYDSAELSAALRTGMNATILHEWMETHKRRVRTGRAGAHLRGNVTGTLATGFQKVPDLDAEGRPRLAPDGLPLHKRALDPTCAPIIRQVFERFANGESTAALASWCNDNAVGGRTAWDCATVKRTLRNAAYKGEFVFNRSHTRMDQDESFRAEENPPEQWHTFSDPALAIVPFDLWDTVQARLDSQRSASTLTGKLRCFSLRGQSSVLFPGGQLPLELGRGHVPQR